MGAPPSASIKCSAARAGSTAEATSSRPTASPGGATVFGCRSTSRRADRSGVDTGGDGGQDDAECDLLGGAEEVARDPGDPGAEPPAADQRGGGDADRRDGDQPRFPPTETDPGDREEAGKAGRAQRLRPA